METAEQQTKAAQPDAKKADGEVVIHIEHLKKAFGEKVVLSDINMDLRKGENVVVLGRSGQGKSVAIKCIVGLLQQDDGVCNVFGKEVKTLSETELKDLRMKMEGIPF